MQADADVKLIIDSKEVLMKIVLNPRFPFIPDQ